MARCIDQNPEAILHSFIEKFSLDPVVALTYARRYYSKKTLLFLVDILVGLSSKKPQFTGDLWYNSTVKELIVCPRNCMPGGWQQ